MEFNREDNQSVKSLYEIFLKSSGFTTDSREAKEGYIFFALKGENFNGNKFAQMAIEKGAICAVVDEKEYAKNEKCFLVNDVLSALQHLANYHRRQFPNLKVFSITGTNGKTTTKELCYAVLSQKYNTIATLGNFNNHIGVPLTLLRITNETEVAIVEMGANHVGEIDFLCHIAEPQYGMITNIGRAHLEGFGGFNGVIKAKTEMFRYLDKENCLVLANLDDKSIAENIKTHNNKFIGYNANIIEGETATIEYEGKIVKSNLIGSYNGQNIMAALTIGKIFDVPVETAIKAIEEYIPSNHRSQIKKTQKNTLILDCYNANPSSVSAALKDFKANKAINKVVCIGAMKELGEESIAEHKKVIEQIREGNFNKAIIVGNEFKGLYNDDMIWFSSSEDAKNYIISNPMTDSTILIKGSHSTKMEILEDVL